ncbi:LysR family transcriptional regulator [Acidihalobacter aeolianus]|uniref:LysR family transcriptional regulator n=1 Tax=Acidihalobacter aeolianus TaxID=2792603 RepID=A0A1D8K7S0_9GAMM|nr:LysR family transcriptional regulator [Acidihalobacter aeolianus]AOV17015.1 LysR family transcriptional regulator [Acidihalobacter aeolianus]
MFDNEIGNLLRHITFRQLQIFMAVVEQKSFTKAAEKLFLTQSSVSVQVKKLADAIGVPLFKQTGRKIQLTDVGQELCATAKQMLGALENLEMSVADYQGLKRGNLKLGVVTTAKYIAPELLGEYGLMFPGIQLAMNVTNRDKIIDRIKRYDDDLYVMGLVPEDEVSVTCNYFAPNPLVVLAPSSHRLCHAQGISLEEIAKEPFLLREPGSGTREAIMRLCRERNLKLNVRMELGSNEAIKHGIVGGLGISVLSLHSLVLEGVSGMISVLDVEGFPIMRKWYLVYPKEKTLSLPAQRFIEFSVDREDAITKRLAGIWPKLSEYVDGS